MTGVKTEGDGGAIQSVMKNVNVTLLDSHSRMWMKTKEPKRSNEMGKEWGIVVCVRYILVVEVQEVGWMHLVCGRRGLPVLVIVQG